MSLNYENLYQEYQGLEKELKDKISTIQKFQKSIAKSMESGDIKSFQKDIVSMQEASSDMTSLLEKIKNSVEIYDFQSYFEQGDFTEQMLQYCHEYDVDAKGEFPSFEMFPYRVKLDAENLDIQVDRKRTHCMRPKFLVKKIKTGQEKLLKASFNASVFANELADAYDLALIKLNKDAGVDFYLTGLYKFLAPMGRFRKEYDQQNYAFDLARLYSSGLESIKDGRKFQFGPSRNNAKSIRILDKEGKEQFLATIRFF